MGSTNFSDPHGFDDVRLIFDNNNKVILAPRIILSAASPVFKDLLEDSSLVENTKILMPSFDYIIMKKLCNFFYSGEAFLDSKDQLNKFIEFSNMLGLMAFRDVENHQVNAFKSMPNDIELCNDIERNIKSGISNQSVIESNIDTNKQREFDNKEQDIENRKLIGIKIKEENIDPLGGKDIQNKIKLERTSEQKERRKMRGQTQQMKSLHCLNCSYKTIWHGDLSKHNKAEHAGVRYKCDKCDEEFKGKSNLNRHIEGRHEGVKFTCKECSYSSIIKSAIKDHVRSKHDGERFQCNECTVSFLFRSSLKKHIQAKHLGIKFNCDYCPKVFERLDNAKHHTNVAHYGSIFKCEISGCEYSSKSRFEVKMHIKSVHRKEKFPCKNDDCDFEADSYKRVRLHYSRSHPKTVHECTMCAFKDPESYKLKKHMETRHVIVEIAKEEDAQV